MIESDDLGAAASVGGFPMITPKRKTGAEQLMLNEEAVGVTLSEFWAWSTSDLVANVTRGVLAEFIVATALGIPTDGVRDSWAAWDLTTSDGIKIEVKSAAYLQGWKQAGLSKITFSTPKTLAWDAETATYESERRRQASVYVFALLHHVEQETLNPLDLVQWRFYVLPTVVLDERKRSQHSITLRSLEDLTSSIGFGDLGAAVRNAKASHAGRSMEHPATDHGASSRA